MTMTVFDVDAYRKARHPSEFPHTKRKWDQYSSFHANIGHGLILFENGEMIATSSRIDPGQRSKRFNRYGLLFVMPHDVHPALTKLSTDKDGNDVVRKTWLEGCTLMVDAVTQQVVRLGYQYYHGRTRSSDLPASVPTHIAKHGFQAYYGGDGLEWIGSPIRYVKPATLTKDEKAHLTHIVDACKTVVRVSGLDHWGVKRRLSELAAEYQKVATKVVDNYHDKVDFRKLLATQYTDLHEYERLCIGANGVSEIKDYMTASTLYFTGAW